MTQDLVLDIMKNAIYTLIMVSSPTLIIALSVGIIVSIFQAVTSIQEPTLAFVPKILAVFISIILFGPYIMTTVQDFIINLYNQIPSIIVPM